MKYRISETTDSKFVGTCIDAEKLFIGNEINIGEEFIFEIDYINRHGNIIIASNANYVMILKEEQGGND